MWRAPNPAQRRSRRDPPHPDRARGRAPLPPHARPPSRAHASRPTRVACRRRSRWWRERSAAAAHPSFRTPSRHSCESARAARARRRGAVVGAFHDAPPARPARPAVHAAWPAERAGVAPGAADVPAGSCDPWLGDEAPSLPLRLRGALAWMTWNGVDLTQDAIRSVAAHHLRKLANLRYLRRCTGPIL